MPCLKLIKPKNARYHNGYKATQMSMRPTSIQNFFPYGTGSVERLGTYIGKKLLCFLLERCCFQKA